MLKKCKYLLFGLGLLSLVITGFSSAKDVIVKDLTGNMTKGEPTRSTNISILAGNNGSLVLNTQYKFVNNTVEQLMYCYKGDGGSNFIMYFGNSQITIVPDTNTYSCILIPAGGDCLFNSASSTTLTYYVEHSYADNFSSLECQEEYSLMPISSCDINYCVENDLCPTSTGSRSELVINDIVHEGKPLINLNIPDYIYWDYTGNENQYDIYIGSGYDQDYIDSILAINSYRPDSEDFTQIFVSGLTLIFPYIFVALLIVFMWKLLKRIFK